MIVTQHIGSRFYRPIPIQHLGISKWIKVHTEYNCQHLITHYEDRLDNYHDDTSVKVEVCECGAIYDEVFNNWEVL